MTMNESVRHPAAIDPETASATAIAVSPGDTDRISWGAIFAGLVCAVALQALLTLLGVAWGFATIDPTEELNPFAGLALGAGAWWLITSIISMFTGGIVAGRTAGLPLTPAAVIHGVCVWALATIIALWMAASAATATAAAGGNMVAAAAKVTGEGSEATIDLIAAAAPEELPASVQRAMRQQDLTADDIRAELREMYRNVVSEQERERATDIAGNTARDILRTPGDFSSDISTALDRLFGGPTAVLSEEDRAELQAALRERFDLSAREAEVIATRWEQRWEEASARVETAYENAMETAAEASETAAEAAAASSLGAFLAGFFGLLAAAVGGALGRPKTIF